MSGYRGPALPSEALEFCARIYGKESTPGGNAALSILDETERATLADLLGSYNAQGATSVLERQARTFLIGYRERELHAGVLDAAERQRLDRILDEPKPHGSHPRPRPTAFWHQPSPGLVVTALVAVIVLVLAGVFHNAIADWFSPPQAPPPVSQPLEPVQQHPPVLDPLQQTSRLLGPWRTIAPSDQNPETARPAVLLLTSNGATEASLKYTVPPAAPGWHVTDASDVITNQSVNGSHVDITAANGMTFVVGVDQPFWFEDNPAVIFRIDQTGRVYTISVAEATAGRQALPK